MAEAICIRPALAADLPAVAAIYDEIHAAEEAGTLTTGWLRGVYPTAATAEGALERGELFVLEDSGAILGAAILNRTQVDVYAGAPWEFDAPDEAVCVLHTLVISPRASRRGLGRRFVAFYESYARTLGCRELRIDTNARNLAARTMYARLGYREIAAVPTTFTGIPGVQLILLEKHLPL